MGRRSDHTRSEIEKMMCEAAFCLVEEKGIGEFQARPIAKAVGYSVGTLYNLFGDMEGLQIHVNVATLKLLFQKLRRGVRSAATLRDLGEKIGRTYLRFIETHPGIWSLLFEIPVEHRPSWYQDKIDGAFSEFHAFLLPFLGKRATPEVAQLLWASLHGICTLKYRGKLGKKRIEPMCGELFDRFS